MKTKWFIDIADRASLLAANSDPTVQGMTTNPSLMRKAGVTHYKAYCQDLLQEIREKPISFEVFADDLAGMRKQAMEILTWGKNVYVKIPVMNTEGQSTVELIRELSQKGVKLNVTAVFTLEQTWSVCQALQGGAPSILSIFAGRIADTGVDPMPIMRGARAMCDEMKSPIELLWASSREPFNIIQAQEAGCHIITITPEIHKKAKAFGKDLFAMSMDTVQTFKKDSDAAGFTL